MVRKSILGEDYNSLWSLRPQIWDVSESIEDHIRYELEFHQAKREYIYPDTFGSQSSSDLSLIFMNALWMTYEAIPLLKSLPQLTLEGQDYITLAIAELEKLRKRPEYKSKANTFIYSLSLFSLLSIYSTSFDFDKVESPTDLSCQFQPDKLVDNYKILKSRFQTLLSHAKEADIPEETLAALAPYEEIFKSYPEELPSEFKDKFVQQVRADQEKSCSVESLL